MELETKIENIKKPFKIANLELFYGLDERGNRLFYSFIDGKRSFSFTEAKQMNKKGKLSSDADQSNARKIVEMYKTALEDIAGTTYAPDKTLPKEMEIMESFKLEKEEAKEEVQDFLSFDGTIYPIEKIGLKNMKKFIKDLDIRIEDKDISKKQYFNIQSPIILFDSAYKTENTAAINDTFKSVWESVKNISILYPLIGNFLSKIKWH